METTVGYQRFTTVGNVVPTGTDLRVYSIDAHSTISTTGLTLHNGLVSSTTATIYLRFASDSQGNIHEEFSNGIYFPNGVWIDTAAAGTITTLVGYSRVTA